MAHNGSPPTNPLDPTDPLQPLGGANPVAQLAHPQREILPEDSAVTKAEKVERHGDDDGDGEIATKRIKLAEDQPRERVHGVTPIKPEFLIHRTINREVDDDAAEAAPRDQGDERKKKKKGGQNKGRKHAHTRDEVGLCSSRANRPEFSPEECQFGDDCKFEHDLRKYLKEWKREDLATFDGVCPIFQTYGQCESGWKCRFVGSHMEERETEKGDELVLKEEPHGETREEILNNVNFQVKSDLAKRKFGTPKADEFSKWLDEDGKIKEEKWNGLARAKDAGDAEDVGDNRALYVEAPFRPSEKRKIYFGPETPVLAPLTTQGNLPFRRLCVSLGAQATYSEMAMSLPLLQGSKSEWALMRAHASESEPPTIKNETVVENYDHSKDSKFGAQIAGNKPWVAMKATEVLAALCPQLRVIDLNCGCPIDLVYRTGAGSGLLDSQGKLEKMLRGMNAVSGEIPITVKIRTGTKDSKPTAIKLVERLVQGGEGANQFKQGPCGIAAITLHGRSRQQRYTRSADWKYIADCATMIKQYNTSQDDMIDTADAPDERDQAANGKVYFLGNGDCYSHTDYYAHLEHAKVDAVMVARGALIKPWIFEEISTNQYLDKSATERLTYVEQFVKNGLEVWGSDERGVGLTRRFLLEWLNFAHRYVPVGLLEYLPPRIQDRPPAWQGRNELETLLASDDYKDWIKISEMFLGPAHGDFNFVPKHKSNSYEIEAEG